MQENNINYDEWVIFQEKIEFMRLQWTYELGWYNEGIDPERHSYQQQGKLIPYLLYFYATKANQTPENLKMRLSQKPTEIKDLFLKFYQKDLKKIVLHTSIIAQPNALDCPQFALKYSIASHRFAPDKPIPIYPKDYEFLIDKFWVENRIYRKTKLERKPERIWRYSPFELQWEAIFSCIYRNFIQIETRPMMDEFKFIEFLLSIRELAKDTIVYPINKMADKVFKERTKWFVSNKNCEEDCKDLGMNFKRWENTEQLNKDIVYRFRLLDAQDRLNSFFKEHNYAKMKNALELFLLKMFESFADDLVKNNLLTKCAFCGEYFHFQKGKKYCSLITKGKDCGKSARNKRYYSVKGKERLPKYRQTTQELRKLYKERGIKK